MRCWRKAQKIHLATHARIFRAAPFCYLAILWPRWREIFGIAQNENGRIKTFLKGCACFRRQGDNDDGWFWNTKGQFQENFITRVYPKAGTANVRRKREAAAFAGSVKRDESHYFYSAASWKCYYLFSFVALSCLFSIFKSRFWRVLMNWYSKNMHI